MSKNAIVCYVVLIVFVAFTSCQSDLGVNKNNQIPMSHEIVEGVEFIDLELDDTTLPYSFVYNVFYQDLIPLLAWVNKNNNEISIFNLIDKKLIYKVRIPRSGPNGVKSISAIKMIDLSNAYIVSTYYGEVVKYNIRDKRRGEVLDLFSGLDTKNYIFNSPTCKIEIVDGRLYTCSQSPLNTYSENILLYSSSPVGRWVDTVSGESGYGGMKNYPETYSNVFLPAEMWNYSREIVEAKLAVYSFSCDHNIYVEDIQDGNITSKYCKSTNIQEAWPVNTARDEYTDVRYKIETAVYESIIYDPFRKIYYRIYRCNGKVENPNDIYTAMKRFQSRKVGIVVLNENFEIIADKVLEKTYYSPAFFVLSDGLYLSVENPTSPELNENKMSFSRIDVLKK